MTTKKHSKKAGSEKSAAKSSKQTTDFKRAAKSSGQATDFKRILKFAGVGFATTIFDYLIYELIVMIAFGGNADKTGISSIISGLFATIMAYILHNKITWKERNPGKYGIVKFFLWNILVVVAIRPLLTALFTLLTGFHEFVYLIVGWIPLFSSFDFVRTTTIYVLMMLITMTLNYIFYEKIVFGSSKQHGQEVDVQSVRQSGEKQQGKGKTNQHGNK